MRPRPPDHATSDPRVAGAVGLSGCSTMRYLSAVDLYLVALATGAVGLGVMAVGGLSHGFNWSSLLSPRVLFALVVGFGAGGVVAAPLGEPLRFAAAILTAGGFELLLVRPLWRFLFRFESSPALTLESAIEDEALAGGESYFRYRQIEMIPIIAPDIAAALGEARLITISGGQDGGAANSTTNQIASVIQTVLAAQLVSKGGMLGEAAESKDTGPAKK